MFVCIRTKACPLKKTFQANVIRDAKDTMLYGIVLSIVILYEQNTP